MREDEIDSFIAVDKRATDFEMQQDLKSAAKSLTKVFEKVFSDFQDSIDSAALNCHNSDASTALYEMSSCIDSMDIGWNIREALEIPHGPPDQPKS